MCWEEQGHGPSEQLGCDSWADVVMSCEDLASGMWSGWFSCEREKLWQVETGLIPEMNKFKNVNTAFSSFFLLFVPRWCEEVRAVLVAGLAVCVCVDARSDSSSFREKPRTPVCHNTSDSASCPPPFVSSSFTGVKACWLMEASWLLASGWKEGERRTGLSIVRRWIVPSLVSCVAECFLCAGALACCHGHSCHLKHDGCRYGVSHAMLSILLIIDRTEGS